MDYGVAIGYGTEHPSFWLSAQPAEGPASGPNREIHVAFQAPDPATVRAFFAAATATGAEVLHEPRIRPEYHERYFGAFVRDPDGNNVEAVCHNAGPDD
jgi:catechol 2,3-dioxygenase-like lactoylglutathione lyase family enzyme